ncbi:MAG: HDOD domain-containing protein [Nitrospirae bacterium]|nr:HDOD domain-containing protein [Nitrospirota bacterium]
MSELFDRLLRSKDLPTIPVLHQKIVNVLKKDNYSEDDISKLLEKDQVLASKLLKLVNSPFYGVFGRVASVKRAAMLLGSNLLNGFVMSATLFNSTDKSIVALWDHSYCCSTVAGYIAKKLNMKTAEEVMTGALIHDLGKVLIKRQLPEEAIAVEEAAKSKRITALDAEKMVIGMSHDEVGIWLAEQWNLPKIIKDIIGYHHSPSLCSAHPKEAAVVHLADIIVKGIGVTGSSDLYVPALDEKALAALALSDDDIMDIVTGVVSNIESDEMFSKYLPQQ